VVDVILRAVARPFCASVRVPVDVLLTSVMVSLVIAMDSADELPLKKVKVVPTG
jgi:hypothetical protein